VDSGQCVYSLHRLRGSIDRPARLANLDLPAAVVGLLLKFA
jgi:hypothetical protein